MSRLNESEYQKASEFTFSHFDSNKTGFLDRAQLTKILSFIAQKANIPLTDAIVDIIFAKIDLDKDGKVSLADFYQTLSKFYFA